MRILFTTYPAFGHLHPVVPLAQAAQAAGHDVRFASGPNLMAWARRCGLQPYPIGLSEETAAAIADRDFAGPERTGRMFTDVWVPPAISDLLELTTSWSPDLVVHEEEEYAGVLLAAIRGTRCITQSWSAPARPAAGRDFATGALTPIWRQHLPGATTRRVGEVYLDACPPPFQTSELSGIAQTTRVITVRPGVFDGPPMGPPEFLLDLPRPAVYLTLGTVAVFSAPDMLGQLASTLASQFASVIVTTGPNLVESLGDTPANVHATRYLPQSSVLPMVDLMVSHGGAGGTVGALMHAVPHMILAGRGQSQITIADAVERIGVGISLREGHRRPTDIVDAARRLTADPTFAARSVRIRALLEDLPGPEDVLDLLASPWG